MNPSEPRGQCGNVRGMRCLNWAGARLTLVPRLRGVDHQIAGLALQTDIPPQLANYTDTIFWPYATRGGHCVSSADTVGSRVGKGWAGHRSIAAHRAA